MSIFISKTKTVYVLYMRESKKNKSNTEQKDFHCVGELSKAFCNPKKRRRSPSNRMVRCSMNTIDAALKFVNYVWRKYHNFKSEATNLLNKRLEMVSKLKANSC